MLVSIYALTKIWHYNLHNIYPFSDGGTEARWCFHFARLVQSPAEVPLPCLLWRTYFHSNSPESQVVFTPRKCIHNTVETLISCVFHVTCTDKIIRQHPGRYLNTIYNLTIIQYMVSPIKIHIR